jgi:diketogulonate reductase-like aldo/keto reductase
MLLIAPWGMAGLSITLTTGLLTTLHRMISGEVVSLNKELCSFSAMVSRTNIPSLPAVPKFQGENFYKNKAIVEEIKKLASRKGCTVSQIALAWVASQGMIAIPGTTKATRLEENWSSRDVELNEEEKQEMRKIIDAAKPHGNRYAPAQQAMVGH